MTAAAEQLNALLLKTYGISGEATGTTVQLTPAAGWELTAEHDGRRWILTRRTPSSGPKGYRQTARRDDIAIAHLNAWFLDAREPSV